MLVGGVLWCIQGQDFSFCAGEVQGTTQWEVRKEVSSLFSLCYCEVKVWPGRTLSWCPLFHACTGVVSRGESLEESLRSLVSPWVSDLHGGDQGCSLMMTPEIMKNTSGLKPDVTAWCYRCCHGSLTCMLVKQ